MYDVVVDSAGRLGGSAGAGGTTGAGAAVSSGPSGVGRSIAVRSGGTTGVARSERGARRDGGFPRALAGGALDAALDGGRELPFGRGGLGTLAAWGEPDAAAVEGCEGGAAGGDGSATESPRRGAPKTEARLRTFG